MIPQWIIERKRDGHALSEEEIRFFINGFTRGEIPDYQMAAMAMAIYLKGMNAAEIAVLTDAMMRSGDVMDLSAIRKPKVDKHSTGGVGDKVSLILAPMTACCGLAVPMVSGRGLGITGGTLDKLSSVPGYRCDLSTEELLRVVDTCGCCITGQTGELAPADKRLYALRDVTATVPSIALITASIMCKKMAEGIDSLVLDVKWGAGAFMKTVEDARVLANSMVSVGREMGKGVSALITAMNQPLGRCAGNALEIRETLDCLAGNPGGDLMEVTLTLGERMLLLAKRAPDAASARRMLLATIQSGQALAKFREMMQLQGADVRALDNPDLLPAAAIQKPFKAPRGGYIAGISAEQIGRASLTMGAGRKRTDDGIDYAVGVSDLAKVGDRVEPGQPLLVIHANDVLKLEEAGHLVEQAFAFSDEPVEIPPLVADHVG